VKIAYLVPESGISGGQRVIFQQAEELAARALDVTLVSPSPLPIWFPLRRACWQEAEFSDSPALRDADVRVATFWTTVAAAVCGARGPVFHLCQGYEADFSFYARERDAIRAAYAQPTRKLAVAPHVAERLRREGHAGVAMIGQAFDPKVFPPAPDRRFDAASPTILLVGSYQADVKGIPEALEALAEARREGISFELWRISATPLEKREQVLGLASRHDVGLLPGEMSAAYRSADLFLGPNHAEEGFGLPALEALSSGLPALLSDTPGHRHIARDAADYFTVGDASALLSGLRAVLADPERRRRLSRAGPEEVVRFRTADVADRLVAEFRAALDGSQAAEK
jgi:glycosyltransferase involved in cell wall biosynthesis